MPINPNIALQVQPVQIENPLNNLAKFAALQQAQEQQQMNALKMQEYQRSVDEQNQLRQYLAGGMPDKEEGLLRYGAAGRGVYESLLKGKKESREASKLETEEIAKRLDIRQAQLQNVRTPDQYRMWVQGNFADPVLSRYWSAVGANPAQVQEQVEAMLAQPNGLAMAVQESKDAYAPLREGLVAQAKYPWHTPTPVTMGTGVEGESQLGVLTPGITPEGKAGFGVQGVGPVRKAYPPAPPAPTTVTIADPATGQPIVVNTREYVGGGAGAPGVVGASAKPSEAERLSAKDLAAREAKYPQATMALKAFDAKSDEMISDIERLMKHPGLGSITGVVFGRTPSLTPDGREAQALYDKIIARGGFEELSAMRQSSPTGGALGNVSNMEGQQLKQSFGALDRTQTESSLVKGLKDVLTKLQGAKERVREAYDMTYEYKQGREAPAGSEAGATPRERSGKIVDFGSLK